MFEMGQLLKGDGEGVTVRLQKAKNTVAKLVLDRPAAKFCNTKPSNVRRIRECYWASL